MECIENWYEHISKGAVEDEEVKLLSDINVQFDNVIGARKLGKVVVAKKEHTGIVTDIAVPADLSVGEKKGKSKKVPDIEERDWKIVENQTCKIVPVVIGAP